MENIGVLHIKREKTDKIESYELQLGKNIIGRPSMEKPSTIEIDGDKRLSRQHFIIDVRMDNEIARYLLQDNRSLNGTQIISGKRKRLLYNSDEQIYLQDRDIIEAGNNILFELEIPSMSSEEMTEQILKPNMISESADERISVPVTLKGKKQYQSILCKQILCITADENYAHIHIIDEEGYRQVWTNRNLKHFEELFRKEPCFFKIHKSTIVNTNKIKSYYIEEKEGKIVLVNDVKFTVSRTHKEEFEKFFLKK